GLFFFFSSRRRHTRFSRDWSSDVCSSDLLQYQEERPVFIRPIYGQWGMDPAVAMPTGASPYMRNLSVYQGFLRKRPGYGQHVAGNDALDGPVVGLFSHKNAAGNTFLIACTPTSVYRFNDVSEDWDKLSG